MQPFPPIREIWKCALPGESGIGMDTYGRKIMAVTGTGTFLSVVNTSSLLIAIPAIIIGLRVTFFIAIWIIVAYSLALTVLTPILGKYSDIVGRKRLYSLGYLIFFAGSVISAASPNGDMVLAGRVIQGVGGAMLLSNSLAIITDTFKAVDLRRAIGINSAILAFGASIGPLIGGMLTDITWRAVFLFNIPISLAGYFFAARGIREMQFRGKGFIDARGAVLLCLTIILAVFFMTILPGTGILTVLFMAPLILTVLFFVLFRYQEKSSEHPIINPEILRNRTISLSTISLIFSSIARFSVLFLLTLLFEGPMGYSALMAGILIVPFAGSMGIFSFLSGSMKQKVSDRTLEAAGLAFTGIGALILGLLVSYHAGFLLMALPMIVVGAGNGVFYTPNSTIIMLAAPAHLRGETAGVRTLTVNLGSVIGLTVVFLVISAYVPASIVNSIFLGLTGGDLSAYRDLFYLASEIVLLVAGILSLLPVAFILYSNRARNQ